MGLSGVVGAAGAPAAAIAGAAALVLGSPATAFALPPTLAITVHDTAVLEADGAGVRFGLTISCTSPNATVAVTLVQQVGTGLTQAYGYNSATCTGSAQDLTVLVVGSNVPLHTGLAIADGSIYGCIADQCASGRDQKVVDIHFPGQSARVLPADPGSRTYHRGS